LPAAKRLHDGQDFLEQVAYSIRNIHKMKERTRELSDPYFKSLFDAADKSFASEANLKIYDNMIRDKIHIKAEKFGMTETGLSRAIGDKGNSSLSRVTQIAAVLNVPITELFAASDELMMVCPKCGSPLKLTIDGNNE